MEASKSSSVGQSTAVAGSESPWTSEKGMDEASSLIRRLRSSHSGVKAVIKECRQALTIVARGEYIPVDELECLSRRCRSQGSIWIDPDFNRLADILDKFADDASKPVASEVLVQAEVVLSASAARQSVRL